VDSLLHFTIRQLIVCRNSYILNRGWIDRSANHIPTYGEITSTKSKGKGKAKQEAPDSDSDASGDEVDGLLTVDPEFDDEDFEEIVDRFESSYNFRFEEPYVTPYRPKYVLLLMTL
jgi:protein KRI1